MPPQRCSTRYFANIETKEFTTDAPGSMSRVMTSLAEIIADQTSTYLPASRIGVVVIVSDSSLRSLDIAKFESRYLHLGNKHVRILYSSAGRSKQTISEYILRRVNLAARGIEIQLMTNIITSWSDVQGCIDRLDAVDFGAAAVDSGDMGPMDLLRASYDRVTQDDRIAFVEACIVNGDLYPDATVGYFTIATTAIRCLLDIPDISSLRTAPEWEQFVNLARRFE